MGELVEGLALGVQRCLKKRGGTVGKGYWGTQSRAAAEGANSVRVLLHQCWRTEHQAVSECCGRTRLCCAGRALCATRLPGRTRAPVSVPSPWRNHGASQDFWPMGQGWSWEHLAEPGHCAAAKPALGSKSMTGLSSWAALARIHLWQQSQKVAPAPVPAAVDAEHALAGVSGWVEGGKDSSAMAQARQSSLTQSALREGA